MNPGDLPVKAEVAIWEKVDISLQENISMAYSGIGYDRRIREQDGRTI